MARNPGKIRGSGFTFVEIAAAIAILTVGLLALAGVLIGISRQREQASARSLVLAAAQSLLEEIGAADDPRLIRRDYHDAAFRVEGVTGALAGGSALHVSVEASEPRLVRVDVDGSWTAGGRSQSLALGTLVHSPQGQLP